MELTVDLGRCIGAGQCALLVPEVFEQQQTDGTVRVRSDRLHAAPTDEVRRAVQLCPAQALELEE